MRISKKSRDQVVRNESFRWDWCVLPGRGTQYPRPCITMKRCIESTVKHNTTQSRPHKPMTERVRSDYSDVRELFIYTGKTSGNMGLVVPWTSYFPFSLCLSSTPVSIPFVGRSVSSVVCVPRTLSCLQSHV